MKRTAFLLAALPAISFATPFDLLLNQRNIADTATLQRQVASSGIGTTNILMTDPFTGLPVLNRLGNSFFVNMSTTPWTIESGSDWSAVTNKPIFAPVATSGDYNDLTNKPSGSQVNSDWSASSGAAEILNKPTTLAGYGISDAYPLSGNPSGFLTGIDSGQVTAALGFTPYNSSNPSGFVSASGARSSISLTTTGTGGAATYNSATGVLNVPSYAPGTGTVTSITAGAGLSGGTITASGTISMPNTGTAGTYSGVTTDAQGRVTSGTNRSFASPARSLNSAFQISATRDASVTYTVDISVTSLLLAGASGRVYLEYADDAGMTANVVTVNSSPNATGGVLNVTNLGSGNVSGWIPAGKYARIRTVNVSATPTFTFQGSQEVLQ